MTYFSPEFCQQLSELGCVSETNHGYIECDKGLGREHWMLVAGWSYGDDVGEPAFSPADFLATPHARENCIKVWGEKRVCDNCGGFLGEIECWSLNGKHSTSTPNFASKSHRLLELVLSGASTKDIEGFIKESMEGK